MMSQIAKAPERRRGVTAARGIDVYDTSVCLTQSLIVSEGCECSTRNAGGGGYRPGGRLHCCADSSACDREVPSVSDNSSHARERRRTPPRTCSRSRRCLRSRPRPSRMRVRPDAAGCCSRTPSRRRLGTLVRRCTAPRLTSSLA